MMTGLRLQRFTLLGFPYDIYFKEEVPSRVRRFFYSTTFHCRITKRVDNSFRLELNSSRAMQLTTLEIPIVWQ